MGKKRGREGERETTGRERTQREEEEKGRRGQGGKGQGKERGGYVGRGEVFQYWGMEWNGMEAYTHHNELCWNVDWDSLDVLPQQRIGNVQDNQNKDTDHRGNDCGTIELASEDEAQVTYQLLERG